MPRGRGSVQLTCADVELLAAQDVMQQRLHLKGTEVQQVVRSLFTCKFHPKLLVLRQLSAEELSFQRALGIPPRALKVQRVIFSPAWVV